MTRRRLRYTAVINGSLRIRLKLSCLPNRQVTLANSFSLLQREKIPVTPRGGGFGYVGGCVPARGGIALSLMRMNRIKEINFADAVAIVEPGVLTGALKAAVRAREIILSPGPREHEGLHDRGKRRDKCRWAAVFEIRRNAQLRHRPRSRAGKW